MCQISSHVCVFSFWQNMSVKVANLANGKDLCCGEKAEFPLSRAEKNHPTFPRAFIWLVNKFPIVCQLFEDAEYCSIKVWCSRMVASSSLPCHRRLMIKMINEKCSKQDAALHSSLVWLCMQSLIVMSCLRPRWNWISIFRPRASFKDHLYHFQRPCACHTEPSWYGTWNAKYQVLSSHSKRVNYNTMMSGLLKVKTFCWSII